MLQKIENLRELGKLQTFFHYAQSHIYISTALASIIISFWLLANGDIISRDSILYVQIGDAFLDGGLIAAFKVWGWPFYSISFAFISQLTGLNLEHSALLLTIILEAVICVTFIKIYSRIAFDGARLWVAALFILTFVTFNDYRGNILRGYGFWAFTLIALYYFILFYQQRSISNGLIWQGAVFIATLFRPEAIVFAVLGPFFFLYGRQSWREKFLSLFYLNSVFYSLTALLLIALLLSSQLQTIVFANLPSQVVYFSLESILGNFNQAAENFVKHVLPFDYSAKYSHLILASGLLAMLLFKLVSNFTIVYSGIWLAGGYKRWIKNRPEAAIVYYFLALALLILLVFITSRLFVSSRYTVLLLLIGGLVFCQYLDYAFSYLQKHSRFWLIALSVFIAVQFLDGMIVTGAKKTIMKDAAEYAYQNIEKGQKIACNEKRLAFYSNNSCVLLPNLHDHYGDKERITVGKNFQYLLVWVKRKNLELSNALKADQNLQLVKQFANRKDDKVILYRVNSLH